MNSMRCLGCLAGACAFLVTAYLPAEPIVRSAIFDPAVGPNQYAVNFPAELGGASFFMPISGGSFELEVDAQAGAARLLSWSQKVEPIVLFGLSTGPINITMDAAAGSAGTYVPGSRSFSVNARFLVHFDDTGLQEFGFVSPFAMTATESGNIYGVGATGRISMYLEGEGQVAGATFSYTCQTTARFDYVLLEGQAQPGDINLDRVLDIADAVSMLGSLFLSQRTTCEAAGEVNGDGEYNLADPVHLLNFLFRGGPPPLETPVNCRSGER